MKTLLDIQNEIRDLGQLLGDTARRLDTLSAEVRELRTADAGKDTNRYDDIRELARAVPFKGHPLENVEDPGGALRRLYLTLLASVVRLCGEDAALPLAYVQWALERCGLEMTLEDIWTESAKPESVDYDAVREAIRDDLRLCLIVDMLVIAQTGAEDGEPSPAALDYIGSLCAVMGLNGEDVKACSAAVRVMLCGYGNADRDEAWDAVTFPELDCYLGLEGVYALTVKCRTIVLQVRNEDIPAYSSLNWNSPQGSYVQINDILAEIKPINNDSAYWRSFLPWLQYQKEYKAPHNGWFYYITVSDVHYGVISYKNDYTDSIKSWVEKEVRK